MRRDKHETAPNLPEGFLYEPELICPDEEAALLARVRELPFREFEFHGYVGKRRTVSFGWHYDFSGRQLRKADGIPDFLLPLRQTAAAFAGMEPEQLQHVLVIEYGPGAGIGWHRDKAVFGEVVGVSLLSPCVFRMRRKIGERKWERANLLVEPRSAYHLSGPARSVWGLTGRRSRRFTNSPCGRACTTTWGWFLLRFRNPPVKVFGGWSS